MEICGLQKLTTLDYPGKVACTIFTGKCNFRCPFCQNGELIVPQACPEPIEEKSLFEFLEKRKRILDGVCVSGGEPLMHKEILALLQRIKDMGYQVKLDTNGSFPERLKELVKRGLVDYVAMDVKNSPDRYQETAGISKIELSPIRESIAFLLSDPVDYEFRTTVVKELHQEGDFVSIGQWIKGAKRYFLQQFEDSERVLCEGLHRYSKEEMQKFQQLLQATIPNTQLRGIL